MKDFQRTGGNQFGAFMGRGNVDLLPGSKLHLERVKLYGDYDAGGAYWGGGCARLYLASDDEGGLRYFRARDRDTAKDILRKDDPTCRFYR